MGCASVSAPNARAQAGKTVDATEFSGYFAIVNRNLNLDLLLSALLLRRAAVGF